METVFYYSEARDQNFSTAKLEAFNLTELKDLFNEEALATARNPEMFKPIAKFSDKTSALRRVTAVLTTITEEDTENQENTPATEQEVTDPRMDLVTCATCDLTAEKYNMTLVGSAWYCSNEDECEARLNPTTDPNEHNAPEGMVYCGLCKRHVPADTAEPTAEAGIYTCKELCIGKNSLRDKAAKAAKAAKAEPRTPKQKTERKLLFPNDHIITNIIPCPKKKGTKAEKGYLAYSEGMTVAEYLTIAAKEGYFGRDALKYDHEHKFITIIAPNTANQLT